MPTIEEARPYYAGADVVHGFDHVLRVLALAERIGQAEGADLAVLRAAALLHDAAGAAPDDEAGRASHHEASAEVARRVLAAEGWPAARVEAVLHCIRSHRFRGGEPARTLEAQILFDCDKLDVLGAIGVLRTAAYASLAGQPLTGAPSDAFRATGQKEPGEPHTPYHEYLFKLSKIKERLHTASAKAIAEERQQFLGDFFERLQRETAGTA
jgi:uncharacterized protein